MGSYILQAPTKEKRGKELFSYLEVIHSVMMPFFDVVNFAVCADFINFFAEGFLVTVNVINLHISITVGDLMVAVYKLNGHCHESKRMGIVMKASEWALS